MIYAPYPKEYKIQMLRFGQSRINDCDEIIKRYTRYIAKHKDRETQLKCLCFVIREMDLKRFLNARLVR